MNLDSEEILPNYRRWLSLKSMDMTSDFNLAQDLVQEGYIEMWKVLGSYDESRGSLTGWLTYKALNRMRDCISNRAWLGRPKRNQGGHHKPIEAERSEISISPHGSSAASNGEVFTNEWDFLLPSSFLIEGVDLAYHSGEILKALNSLSPQQRKYVYLRFWAGMQTPELKKEFGYDPSSLWNSPRNGAKSKLRVQLEHLTEV